jgi:hypothetical protein
MGRFVLLPLTLVAFFVLLAQGCGSDDEVDPYGSSGRSGSGEKICLLNNCARSEECANCTDGRSVCDTAAKRCVACGPAANGKTCKAGTYCTKYGACVPQGITCPEDGNGVPTGACKSNADCGACSPAFRVCVGGRCAGCTPENVTNCQSTDVCRNNQCVPKCPGSCSVDDDCSECGVEGKEVHACNKHVCAQCSRTKACPEGEQCDLERGVCRKPCGLIRPGKTACLKDENCAGCASTTECREPINGGEGVCVVPATGCSDIATGVVTLPDPWSRATNTCSGDADCKNISADINVGKFLRETTGLGLIRDATFSYGMHACASVELRNISCGVCVPCRQDTDCVDIDIAKLAGDAFGPLGSIGASILLDKVFGPNDKKVHMYCQNISGEYGACLPCPNVLSRCAQSSADVPPTGDCSHDVCTTGGPLGLQCEACVAAVCAKDPYCCTREWDDQCKTDVDLYCPLKSCEKDNCAFRAAGWYCKSDPSLGGYRCSGDPGSEQISEGWQCATGQECRPTTTGDKSTAQLCTTEKSGDPECPLGSLGKPRCFRK